MKEVGRIAPDAAVSGALGGGRVANNIHISFPRADSENLVLEFDRRGICVGSGSACTAHSTEPSHVLRAIQAPREVIHGSVRVSLSRETTKKDIQVFLKALPDVVARVRARSV
jgi:cysteine desulfurase